MKVELIRLTEAPEQMVATAGRVCYSGDAPEEVHRKVFRMTNEQVQNQLDIIHGSCYEHVSYTFAIEGISRAATHQLVRHRLASFSQQSQRYVKTTTNDVYRPHSIPTMSAAEHIYLDAVNRAFNAYNALINQGIPKEDARYILPEGILSNIIVTMNARELLHFFGLRCCRRAQEEIRELADKMLEEAKRATPLLMKHAGPQCAQLGYCPEHKGCGRVPNIDEYRKAWAVVERAREIEKLKEE